MEFGKTLREAREAKGYSTAQLAELTHIYVRTLEGMEREDFREIPAPIYGRGFVKLCCQHLDLDQKAMIDEFMSIYNGEKPAHRGELPADAAPAADPVPPPAESEPDPAPEIPAEPPPAPEPPPASAFGELFNQPPEPAVPERRNAPSRFAPPQPQDFGEGRGAGFELPAIPWRLVILILGALAVLWAVIAGCRSVYLRLSEPEAAPAAREPATPVPVAATKPAAAVEPVAAKTPRKAKPVKPLYLD